MQETRNLIGWKLRQLRRERGLSQEQLAAKIQIQGYDIGALAILRIERGTRTVKDVELQEICRYFQISAAELLGF